MQMTIKKKKKKYHKRYETLILVFQKHKTSIDFTISQDTTSAEIFSIQIEFRRTYEY